MTLKLFWNVISRDKKERERDTPTHEPLTDSFVISISIFGPSCYYVLFVARYNKMHFLLVKLIIDKLSIYYHYFKSVFL